MRKLTKQQKNLLKIMDFIHEISIKHNFRYSLEAGTALGAVREKGFIPWDDDIDITIHYSHFSKFMDKLRSEKGDFIIYESRFIPEKKTKMIDVTGYMGRVYYKGDFVDIVSYTFTKSSGTKTLDILEKIKWFKNWDLSHYAIEDKWNIFEKFGFRFIRLLLCVLSKKRLYKMIKKRVEKKNKKSGDIYFPFWTYDSFSKRKKWRTKNTKENFVLVDFEDRKYFCRENIKEMLVMYYGEDYMIPKRENYFAK